MARILASKPLCKKLLTYSEALFKTCKYRPGFPDKPFESLGHALLRMLELRFGPLSESSRA